MIIGIDYSLNSTGLTFLHNQKYKFFNIRSVNKEKNDEYINGIYTKYFVKNPTKDLTYSNKEVVKLNNILAMNDLVSNIIINQLIDIISSEITINIEGFSYGGSGNSMLDVAGGQYLLRAFLNRYGFNVFTPGQVKKIAGGGRFKKEDMINSFKNEIGDFVMGTDLYEILNNGGCLTKQGNYVKGVDDVVDSYFLTKIQT